MMSTLKAAYAAPFRLISAAARTFVSNRKRLRRFTAKPGMANLMKFAMLATLLAWLVMALLASEEDKKRLDQAFKSFWPETEDNRIPEPTSGVAAE